MTNNDFEIPIDHNLNLDSKIFNFSHESCVWKDSDDELEVDLTSKNRLKKFRTQNPLSSKPLSGLLKTR